MAVSENLRPELEQQSHIEFISEPFPFEFLAGGDLKETIEEALLAETGALH